MMDRIGLMAAFLALPLLHSCGRSGFGLYPEQPMWMQLGASAQGGGVSQSGAEAHTKSVHAASDGTVYALWADDRTGRDEAYLSRWDGSAWRGLGGSAQAGGISAAASATDYSNTTGNLAFDADDHPYVTWMHRESARSLHLKHWDGSAWSPLGDSATGSGLSFDLPNAWWPAITVNALYNPVVCWASFAGISGVYVRHWDGSAWTGLGPSDTDYGLSEGHTGFMGGAIVSGANDTLSAAWVSNHTGLSQVYLTRWAGGVWSGLGGSMTGDGLSATAGNSERLHLISDGTHPGVVWMDTIGDAREIHFKRWNGSDWVAPGGSSRVQCADQKPGPTAIYPGAAFDPDGRPVVVWVETDDLGLNIYAARWDGSAWRVLYDPAVPGGISRTPAESNWPSIEVDTSGRIYVAWEEEVGPDSDEIYLKYLE